MVTAMGLPDTFITTNAQSYMQAIAMLFATGKALRTSSYTPKRIGGSPIEALGTVAWLN